LEETLPCAEENGTFEGIGIEDAGDIALYSFFNLVTSNAEFIDAAYTWLLAAIILKKDYEAVINAWRAVGIDLDPEDDVPNVQFSGLGVRTVLARSAGYLLWHFSPNPAEITLETNGNEEHDVQIRWCDCTLPGTGDDTYLTEDQCKEENCSIPAQLSDHAVSFGHDGWHLASIDNDDNLEFLIAEPLGCEGEPVYVNNVDCRRSHSEFEEYWSQCDRSWDTLRYISHCTPDEVDYNSDEIYTKYWDWENEIWWNIYDILGPPLLKDVQQKNVPAWGYLWIRPEIGEEVQHGTNNHYKKFQFMDAWGTICPWLTEKLPDPFHKFPVIDLIDATVDERLSEDLWWIGAPRILLYGIPSEYRQQAGKFGYGEEVMEENSALGGLALAFVDRYSSEVGEYGYSVGNQEGSLPNTVDFAAVQFSFGVPARLEGILTAGVLRENSGIAVFGGENGQGILENRLWIGRYRGMDGERNPYFSWEEEKPIQGPLPLARKGAVLATVERTRSLLLYGGKFSDGEIAQDLWSYDLDVHTWKEIIPEEDLEGVAFGETIQVGDELFFIGGRKGDGDIRTEILKTSATSPGQFTVVGDMEDGPGARSNISVAYYRDNPGRILVFGGIGEDETEHNDLWEYKMDEQVWSLIKGDCSEESCPPFSEYPALAVSPRGENISVFPSGEHENFMYYKSENRGPWLEDSRIHGPAPETDCDGDGEIEPRTAKACRSTNAWYAEVDRYGCIDPVDGELACMAGEAPEMEKIAEWSPDGWEWVVDLAKGEEAYDYVLTDGTLYTFDVFEPADGIQPIDTEEIEKPDWSCWWLKTDWSYAVERKGQYLYVGSMSGMHVYSVEDPADPEEVAYLESYGKVRDIVVAGEIAYLADGWGITIVDVGSPSEPVEVGRRHVGKRVESLELNWGGKSLYALTPFKLQKYDVLSTPKDPVKKEELGILGLAYWDMKADGNWVYLSGLWNKSVYDRKEEGLIKKGGHNVRAWVAGRITRPGQAERIRGTGNTFEVWGMQD
jgi:hypothetical protein